LLYKCFLHESKTRDQQHFSILEVSADWRELMILRKIMWPSNANVSEQLRPTDCS